MSITNTFGYRCPKCNYAWTSYTKDYNGTVYCQSKKCNYRFKDEKVKITQYSIYELFTQKDLMVEALEKFLKEVKAFDNIHDNNISPER